MRSSSSTAPPRRVPGAGWQRGGLYAASGLIRAMDGSIQVGGAPGGGTTVAFTLPAEAADEHAQLVGAKP